MRLMQSQKNQVYEAIEAFKLSPKLFRLTEPESLSDPTVLSLKDSDYYFIFDEYKGGHYAKYSPGHDTLNESGFADSWVMQLANVRRWLFNVKRETDAADKWKRLQEEIENFGIEDIDFEDSQKFSDKEYEVLKGKIDELKEKIGKMDLLETQIGEINNKLDHLLKLAKDMNKIDWKELFIGSLMSLFMQLSIDKGTGKMIFDLARGVFVKLLPSG